MKSFNSLEYYERACGQIFDSIENPNWRIWKVFDEDGKVFQNKRQITTKEKLLAFIKNAKNPKALYVSISTFLNPGSNHGNFNNQIYTEDNIYHYPREGYLTADCIILDSLFFIDLDSEQDLRIAQNDARKIIKAMDKENNYTLDKIQFSGKKGIHLIYHMNYKSYVPNPVERINYFKREKAKMINKLMKLRLKTIDKGHIKVIEDPFRVFAAPYSIKSNQQVVRPITKEDLLTKDIYDILNMARDPQGNDAQVALNNIKDKGRASLRTYPYYYGCIANFVPGLKNNYVPFIKIYKEDLVKIDLNDLSNEISDFLIFEENDYFWIIGFKIYQKDKLLKLMKRLKAVNRDEFRRRYAKFRYTEIKDKEGKSIEEPPFLLKRFVSDKIYHISKAHSLFFKHFETKAEVFSGSDNLKTYLAKVIA